MSKPTRSTLNRKKKMHHSKTVLIFAILLSATVVGMLPIGSARHNSMLAPAVAEAQNFSQRTILGKVYNGDAPAAGATVFLKNVKSKTVKSFTSTPDGGFRFAQVGMVDDYEVWAEHAGKKSPVKTVSSFDSRKQVEYELKLK